LELEKELCLPVLSGFLVSGFIEPIPLDRNLYLNIEVFMLLLNMGEAENLKINTFEGQIFSALRSVTLLPFHSVL